MLTGDDVLPFLLNRRQYVNVYDFAMPNYDLCIIFTMFRMNESAGNITSLPQTMFSHGARIN